MIKGTKMYLQLKTNSPTDTQKCMANIHTNVNVAALQTATVLVANGDPRTQSYCKTFQDFQSFLSSLQRVLRN